MLKLGSGMLNPLLCSAGSGSASGAGLVGSRPVSPSGHIWGYWWCPCPARAGLSPGVSSSEHQARPAGPQAIQQGGQCRNTLREWFIPALCSAPAPCFPPHPSCPHNTSIPTTDTGGIIAQAPLWDHGGLGRQNTAAKALKRTGKAKQTG